MKRIIAIGGGEIKSKTTLKIDEYIAILAKKHAKDKRAYGLFVGTASHDFMPYFNSFRKTYTSVFDIKADCALTVFNEIDYEKIKGKFEKADFIYIGGGDTMFMLKHWKETGLDKLIFDAYNRGVIICGLSAGAICWFENMYTDSASDLDKPGYALRKGLGELRGLCSPHYNQRIEDFSKDFIDSEFDFAYAIEDNSAIEFIDGRLVGAISAGGISYILRKNNGTVEKFKISQIVD